MKIVLDFNGLNEIEYGLVFYVTVAYTKNRQWNCQ